ncbi:MAG: SurA N-terminal domain-containing protein [Bdellovibrionales bacterium]|nr:SurA N-terminal domain-containing protein [Bdellovibrionales bacterium]
MLQIVNRYYRSVLGTVVLVVVGFSMLLFGVDKQSRNSESYAIRVNEHEVSFPEFYQRKSEVQTQLARSFGENFNQFAAQLLAGLDQRLADELIEESLLEEAAQEIGVSPGKRFVQGMIQQLFPGGFSSENYRSLLRQLGTTAPKFEARLAGETVIRQLSSLLQHVASNPPEEFIRANFLKEERSYSVEVAEFDPGKFLGAVPAPEDSVLKAYYEDHMVEYEAEPRARLSYVVFSPEKFLDGVEAFDEDVELYYTENEREFTYPERVKIQEIVLSLPSENEAESMGVQSLANDLMDRVIKGEDFKALAEQYSDEKGKAAVSDWVAKGSQSTKFDELVFHPNAKETDKEPYLVEDGGELRLVRVVERVGSEVKPLEEVKDLILQELKKREAPIYAAEKAREELEKWKSVPEKTLESIATEYSLPVVSIAELTALSQSTPENRAILRGAIDSAGESPIIVDAGKALALVQVDEFREAEVLGFDEVRERVLSDYKTAESKELASQKARDLLEALKEKKEFQPSLVSEVQGELSSYAKKRAQDFDLPPLSSLTVREAVVGAKSPGVIQEDPFVVNEKQYVVWLSEVVEPSEELFNEKRDELVRSAARSLGETLKKSLVSSLKARADIDIHPSVFQD